MKRILIVDASSESGAGLCKSLENMGFSPQNQSDPKLALERVGADPFDVILVDSEWGAHERFSFELASQLLESAHGAPDVVLLSNEADLPIFEGHQAGASHVLRKPLNMDTLQEIIQRSGPAKGARRFDRVSIDEAGLGRLYGQVSIDNQRPPLSIEVANLGRGGFYFEAPDHMSLASGHIFDFEIKLSMVPGCHISGKGIVRWMHNQGVGVEFLMLSNECEATVRSFVDLFKVKEYVPVAR